MEQTFAKFLNINDIKEETIKQESLNEMFGKAVKQNVLEVTFLKNQIYNKIFRELPSFGIAPGIL